MAGRKEKAPDGIVSTATELGLALYENTGRILIKGHLASAIYYGELFLRCIKLGIIVLFMCLFMSIQFPNVMLPLALICAGFIAVSFLPVIYLRYMHVPLTLILKIKADYKRLEFSASRERLLLRVKKSKQHKATHGAWLKRFKRNQKLNQGSLGQTKSRLNADPAPENLDSPRVVTTFVSSIPTSVFAEPEEETASASNSSLYVGDADLKQTPPSTRQERQPQSVTQSSAALEEQSVTIASEQPELQRVSRSKSMFVRPASVPSGYLPEQPAPARALPQSQFQAQARIQPQAWAQSQGQAAFPSHQDAQGYGAVPLQDQASRKPSGIRPPVYDFEQRIVAASDLDLAIERIYQEKQLRKTNQEHGGG